MKRCAIYTRKSSEEGLDQEFNSLDAQRESCEAYVASQAGEGWSALAKRYDDGGYSGGSMERPGLQALLADVRSGQIDVIVVYKIDRLTRSLADFARIVETLDAHGVSFVSVTQAFNTTSSMGRLTLNVLLSFAQFEREVTGERIRDKIAASKAKGLWMGGLVPLGYDRPTDGSRVLVVNPQEAETVRSIFNLYLEFGTVQKLLTELAQRDIRSKSRVTAKGHSLGGAAFSPGAMFHLLQNRVYVGDIVHKGVAHDGQHAGIIDVETFDRVQALLASHRRERMSVRRQKSPLAGKLFDTQGRRMTASYSRGARGGIYRYYISAVGSGRSIERVSSKGIETFLAARLARLTPGGSVSDVEKVTLGDGELIISLPVGRSHAVKRNLTDDELVLSSPSNPASIDVHCPARIGAGREKPIARGAMIVADRRDPVLIRALRVAHELTSFAKGGIPVAEQYPDTRYGQRLIRLAFLAPTIQQAILAGRQPVALKLEQLIRNAMPIDWNDQQRWIEQLAG